MPRPFVEQEISEAYPATVAQLGPLEEKRNIHTPDGDVQKLSKSLLSVQCRDISERGELFPAHVLTICFRVCIKPI